MLYLGIDQHARQITISLRDENGDVVSATVGMTDEDGNFQVDVNAQAVVAVVVATGVSSLLSIGRQEDPTITNLFATVITPYPGADPARVEALVTEKIEEELREIEEIEEIRSTSRTGTRYGVVVGGTVPATARSWASSQAFVSTPPANPVSEPSDPTTRWHGTMIDSGFLPFAAPTARALRSSTPSSPIGTGPSWRGEISSGW